MNPFKHSMTCGLILGIVFSANFFLSVSGNTVLNLLTYLVIALIIYLTYRFTCHYRDNECDGALRYGQGLSYIILLYFFAAIIATVARILFFKFINPDYLEEIFNQTMLMMEQLNIPNLDTTADQIQAMMQPISFSLQYIWMDTLAGLFVGLIVAAFTKKEKSLFK